MGAGEYFSSEKKIQSHKRLPIAKEGLPFILKFLAGCFILALFPYLCCRILSALFLALAVFCVFFFRDPEREPIQDPAFILAPGDGRVLQVSEEFSPHLGGPTKVIKIFLSIFDIHVQRSPIAGTITAIEYRNGKFLDARHPLAASENEQNTIVIENERCKVAVKQIAGFIARRIACWVSSGDSVNLGQRLGLIRFGSQVDLFLPLEAELCVAKGEKVMGGISAVAVLKSKAQG